MRAGRICRARVTMTTSSTLSSTDGQRLRMPSFRRIGTMKAKGALMQRQLCDCDAGSKPHYHYRLEHLPAPVPEDKPARKKSKTIVAMHKRIRARYRRRTE